MDYRVEISERAFRDLVDLGDRIHADRSVAAARWLGGLERSILKLETFPLSNALAPESRQLRRAVRQLLYGRKPRTYRVLYEVDESRKAVRVLTIRHWARDGVRPGEI